MLQHERVAIACAHHHIVCAERTEPDGDVAVVIAATLVSAVVRAAGAELSVHIAAKDYYGAITFEGEGVQVATCARAAASVQ